MEIEVVTESAAHVHDEMVVLSEMPVASAIQRQHIGTPGPRVIPPRPNSSDGDGRLPVIAGAAPAVPETWQWGMVACPHRVRVMIWNMSLRP